ncbi:hypothetical protein BV22DRAFT_1044709 [Leucogyrophana mollusca]|uniref:Uncharacterized protein n=1 Tax=Leucogyrophana mollusca TaxID=85980 RepID=A0ACB8BTZ8_9AGAM|nr:hypothetical protein BV22DRAFT_1044709 [Leucogyrophana mollusca]
MTVATSSATSHKLSQQPNRDQQFRALDRALARRYVEELLRRNRVLMAQRMQQVELIFRPRQLCDDPSSSRVTATLELPGLKSGDVSVQLEDNCLVVSGERQSRIPTNETGATKFPIQEIKYGKFLRKLDVPAGTMMSTISASMSEGLLVVSWPRTPPGAPSHAAQ